jgi:Spy/CpxP family protein refolding chaperone
LLGVAPQAMGDLALTAEQQTKVQAIVKEFTDELKKLQEKYQKQIRETLTPEQQTKFDKAVEEMKNRMGGGPGRMGGGPGGDRQPRPDRGDRQDRPPREGGAPQPPPPPDDKPVE